VNLRILRYMTGWALQVEVFPFVWSTFTQGDFSSYNPLANPFDDEKLIFSSAKEAGLWAVKNIAGPWKLENKCTRSI
jgi:hypothetical protein